ncbi:MAG TPA: AraC family transcriptional regulator [Fimbriimonadaceae bacterium]|nr:AraC family transcriptional regulator [Fimbriimonadaceae bacterium]
MLEQSGLQVEYGASLADGSLNRSVPLPTEAIHIEEHKGTVKKTSACRIRVQGDAHVLLVSRTATLLVWSESQKHWIVVPPQSLAYFTGRANHLVHLARGDHHITLVSLTSNAAPYLVSWLERTLAQVRRKNGPISVAINPIFRTTMSRLDRALARLDKLTEPTILGLLHEIFPRLALSENDVDLAPLPSDLPPNMKQLSDMVRQDPASPWPLKEAADRVGYSPFHFSRVYKQLVGYGFHEFVDRCRTQIAVEAICNSETAIDVIAATSGFGTTQALRESIKEYLGLVPSELRSEPEGSLKA